MGRKVDLAKDACSLYYDIKLKENRLHHLLDASGPSLYPGALGSKLVLFFNTGIIRGKCVGFTCDSDGICIPLVIGRDGDPVAFKRENLVRYEQE